MNIKTAILAAGTATLLSGCASTHSFASGEIDPADFGEANRQTYAAMIVNPDPVYTEPLETSAEKAAAAIDRYRNDQVKQPVSEDTTSVSGSGG